ncbi:putative adhesin [Bordetella avium 197N]|uniref:Adhesin n=2 Tax=Bordetella avium TaxID=521 RepID=Q2L0Z8_BORA1|nr:putative adhesin [Bordetella avium 197N]
MTSYIQALSRACLMSLSLAPIVAFLPGDPAHAGPLDMRAAAAADENGPGGCSINNGGTTPRGNRYDAYNSAAQQHKVTSERTTFAPVRDYARGELLFSAIKTLPFYTGSAQGQAAAVYGCKLGVVEMFSEFGGHPAVSGLDHTYETGVPGIGYRVYYYYSETGSSPLGQQTIPNPFASGVLVAPFSRSDTGEVLYARIDFIATGEPIKAGNILAATIGGRSTLIGGGVTPAALYSVQLASNVIVTAPTCQIRGGGVATMTLPDVPLTDLQSNGVGPTSELQLTVDCAASSSSAPGITISTANTVAGVPGTLANLDTGTGAAQGVGVELFYIEPSNRTYITPIFGQRDDSMGSSASGDSFTKSWNFGFAARLKRLSESSTLKAGTVNAIATLTFTYN